MEIFSKQIQKVNAQSSDVNNMAARIPRHANKGFNLNDWLAINKNTFIAQSPPRSCKNLILDLNHLLVAMVRLVSDVLWDH